MKKKEYLEAEIEIILLEFADIITESNSVDGDEDYGDDSGVMDKDGWA